MSKTRPGVHSWFFEALAHRPEHCQLRVRGTTIHYRRWGALGHPVLVLVPGGAAHSGWWDHIAPEFALTHCVIAIDPSGHGDSGWRDTYDLSIWADELVAVVGEEALERPVTLVGHSRGGMIALLAASRLPILPQQVVAIDSAFGWTAPPEHSVSRRAAHRVYAAREEAVTRFRTLPHEDNLAFITQHIACDSVRQVPDGWTWKFDPRITGRDSMSLQEIPLLGCRVVLMRAARGLATPQACEAARLRLGALASVEVIEDAGHHVLLQRPMELTRQLRRHIG